MWQRSSFRAIFPAGDERLDDESARLLAMLEDDDAALPRKVAAFWDDRSTATRDLHFLIVLARLRGPRDAGITRKTARAVVRLDGKLEGQEQRIKQSWNARLGETVALLLARDPSLGPALMSEPGFLSPNHVALALSLAPTERERAARGYLDAVRSKDGFVWSGALIELLGVLPAAEVRPLFRSQWENFALRDTLLPRLANPPEPEPTGRSTLDAPRLVPARRRPVRPWGPSKRLPRDGSPGHLDRALATAPPAHAWSRARRGPQEAGGRPDLKGGRGALGLCKRSGDSTPRPRCDGSISPSSDRFLSEHPAARRPTPRSRRAATWPGVSRDGLERVDWSTGDAGRGAKVFRDRGCQTCHAGPRSLGPDLTGVTDRLSRDDLFTAIVAPSLDVSPLYRLTLVETQGGQVYSGLVAFESADGLILQTGATTTVRVATPEIASRHVGNRSLMPDGLLQGLDDRDLADLDRYLRTLSTRGGVKR